MKRIIEQYKRLRNLHQLKHTYDGKFAFVCIGNHSTNNLYPVLDYLHVHLKYICCKSESKLPLVKETWRGVQITTSLDEILADEEVTGVFISINPSAHFSNAKKVLKSRKALFIEKPPCSFLTELQQLMDLEQSFVVTGMQKRYAPATNIFGKAEIRSCEYIHSKNGESLLLTLKHESVTGILELSTAYSWQNANETLTVNTERGIYELNQMETLTFIPKQGQAFGIPLEKVMRKRALTETLFSRNNFVPTNVNNQIYTQGYFDEIKFFMEVAQRGSLFAPNSGFHSMYNTYILIDEINKCIKK